MVRNSCVNCKYSSSHGEPCTSCTDFLKWEAKEPDNVNHPSHYCQEGSMECIDEMIGVFGVKAVKHFCLLNVWKYRKRAIFKNGIEDMKKADWYMKKYLELDRKES